MPDSINAPLSRMGILYLRSRVRSLTSLSRGSDLRIAADDSLNGSFVCPGGRWSPDRHWSAPAAFILEIQFQSDGLSPNLRVTQTENKL